jgi:hypothetical protein
LATAEARRWSKFRFEYVSPVLWLARSMSEIWTLDFSFANRGTTEETFAILLTEFHFEQEQPTEYDPGATLHPGRVFLVNWSFELLGGDDSDIGFDQGWWARIYTTSRDVVPSIHFYAEDPRDAEFYVAHGDFAVFELPGSFRPPVIGPAEP